MGRSAEGGVAKADYRTANAAPREGLRRWWQHCAVIYDHVVDAVEAQTGWLSGHLGKAIERQLLLPGQLLSHQIDTANNRRAPPLRK
jgi:hypothetical protein